MYYANNCLNYTNICVNYARKVLSDDFPVEDVYKAANEWGHVDAGEGNEELKRITFRFAGNKLEF